MPPSSSLPTADYDDGSTTIDAVHPDVIRHHILSRLDGPTLAAMSCVSSKLLFLCNDDSIWKYACNSTWPSTADPHVTAAISAFTSGHRSFFSDAFPALRSYNSVKTRLPRPVSRTPELISAVDIYAGNCDREPVYSKVMVTETLSSWFLNTPFILDLLDSKLTVPIDGNEGGTSHAIGRLRLNWILIDPVKRRAVNVASRKAVESRRNWLTNDVQLRFATVGARAREPVQCAVVVTCGAMEGGGVQMKEVSMHMEDMEGKTVTGREAVEILAAAMEGQRQSDKEEEKDVYEGFMRSKREFREKRARREKGLDIVCIGLVILMYCFCILAFWQLI